MSNEAMPREGVLAAENCVLEMIASGRPLQETLEEVRRAVEAALESGICDLTLVGPPVFVRTDRAMGHAPASLRASLSERQEDFEASRCAQGTASADQLPTVDGEADTGRTERERRVSIAGHGPQPCWSTLLSSAAGDILGVLAIYCSDRAILLPRDRALVDRFADIAAIAIQRERERRDTEQALTTLRSELARAARIASLGALTASIAHEIKQPLSGIVTNAAACLRKLSADLPKVEGARETARRMIRDANRVAATIEGLRGLLCNKSPAIEAIDLNAAAKDVVDLALAEIRERRVVVDEEYAWDLPLVAGNRVQLQQVILNLVLNALDAMRDIHDRQRRLVIKTQRDDGNGVRLSVQDAGVGLDQQGMAQLFEAFYTTKKGGMGIGLSISRSIIESHHGSLWATPNAGPGATFSFSVPKHSVDSAMAAGDG
jgi:C4-dicarboxylate-specific signal transduction histidine kinase